jgi:ribosomal protein S6
MAETIENAEKSELTVYEVGFLVSAQIPEEKVADEVSEIRGIIEKSGGMILAEEFPRARVLAYTILKPVQGKNEKHASAYFGWIKFEAPSTAAPEVKSKIQVMKNIVRSLLVKTVREAPVQKTYFKRKPVSTEPKTQKVTEDRPTISEAELDKTIEELVVE